MNGLRWALFHPKAGMPLLIVGAFAAALAGCDNAKPAAVVAPAAETVAPAAATPAGTATPADAIPLTTGISHEQGFAYTLLLTFDPSVRAIKVYEDGKELGPADSLHDDIRNKGQGRYSQWPSPGGSTLYFSASDNSDPNTNGKKYELR
jgi:pectate lyase